MGVLKRVRNGKAEVVPLSAQAIALGPACQVIKTDRGYLLRDPSSATVMNGQKIREHMLREGDTFSVGADIFTYSQAGGSPPTGRATAVTQKVGETKATQRIAPSGPVPAAPARPPTQRVTVQPPKTGATARTTTSNIPKAAPARPGTQRITPGIPKPGTHGMARPGSGAHPAAGTQRRSGMTTRKTARTTTRRVEAAGFSMPSSRKGKIIAASVAGFIVVAAVVLIVIGRSQEKPEEFKAELAKRLEEVKKIPIETESIRRDDELHKLQNHENKDKFRKYALTMWNEVDSLHRQVHEVAEVQKAADREVKLFIDEKYAPIKDNKEELQRQVSGLIDEATPLDSRYDTTTWGPKLKEILIHLNDVYDKMPKDNFSSERLTLARDRMDLVRKGECGQAWQLMEDFSRKWTKPEFQEKVTGELKATTEATEKAARKIADEAGKKAEEGDKPGAARLLQEAILKFGVAPGKKLLEDELKNYR